MQGLSDGFDEFNGHEEHLYEEDSGVFASNNIDRVSDEWNNYMDRWDNYSGRW